LDLRRRPRAALTANFRAFIPAASLPALFRTVLRAGRAVALPPLEPPERLLVLATSYTFLLTDLSDAVYIHLAPLTRRE